MINRKISRKKILENPEMYFKWRFNQARRIIDLAEKYTHLEEKSILDAGCGRGSLSYLLRLKRAKVYAIDISDEALGSIRKFTKNMKIDIKRASCENLPYKDNTFDLIFNFDVLEHVQNPELTFLEMTRCLKQPGYIILEMTPYWALATGHHLYDFTHLPVQYLPQSLIKKWVFSKNIDLPETPQMAWDHFSNLNKITVSKVRQLVKRHHLRILEENFIFKIPGLLEIKINWIRYFGFLKEMIPMSYQVVLKKI